MPELYSYELEFERDGQPYIVIFGVDDIPFVKYRKVAACYDKLVTSYVNHLKEGKGDITEGELKDIHDRLSPYIDYLGKLLDLNFDEMTFLSKQRLLFGQEDSKPLLDLILSWEMDDELKHYQSEEDEDDPVPTTGDLLVDVECSVYLSFEHHAPYILNNVPFPVIMAMQKRAGIIGERQMEKYDKDAKRKRKRKRSLEPKAGDKIVTNPGYNRVNKKKRANINRQLKEAGIAEMPEF